MPVLALHNEGRIEVECVLMSLEKEDFVWAVGFTTAFP